MANEIEQSRKRIEMLKRVEEDRLEEANALINEAHARTESVRSQFQDDIDILEHYLCESIKCSKI